MRETLAIALFLCLGAVCGAAVGFGANLMHRAIGPNQFHNEGEERP